MNVSRILSEKTYIHHWFNYLSRYLSRCIVWPPTRKVLSNADEVSKQIINRVAILICGNFCRSVVFQQQIDQSVNWLRSKRTTKKRRLYNSHLAASSKEECLTFVSLSIDYNGRDLWIYLVTTSVFDIGFLKKKNESCVYWNAVCVGLLWRGAIHSGGRGKRWRRTA